MLFISWDEDGQSSKVHKIAWPAICMTIMGRTVICHICTVCSETIKTGARMGAERKYPSYFISQRRLTYFGSSYM